LAAAFPTPFSTASGVVGLIAGPSSTLRHMDYRVRPLSPLRLVVAPPACGPGQDTFVTAYPRLDQLAPGRPLLVAVRWPGATGLTSYLSGCFSLTCQRCSLQHRRRFGSFSRALPWLMVLPGSDAHFVPPFSVFRLADSPSGNRQSRPLRAGAQ
jgi:hypothetical protein